MRVLVLTNMYPPHHYGGYELSCRDCVERWRARGHEVTVLTTTMRVPGVPDPPAERAAGVRRELRMYFRDADLHVPPVPVRLLWEGRNQRRLRRALADVRPDVVSIWHMGAMSLGLLTTLRRRRIPLVYAVCDDWPIYAAELDGWQRLFHYRPGLRRLGPVFERLGVPAELPDLGRSGTFCFVSEVERRRCEERSAWSYPDATVVYSGIDRADFPPLDTPVASRPWRWRLLFVGRLDERKGIDTVIRALALLPGEATLSVVGGGNRAYRARLDELVGELGLQRRVTFSVAERGTLRRRYADADVLVFPSEWAEPFGLVPIEAMACATPVVATGTGGSGEFLADGVNCVLFRTGDPADLAATLVRVAGDPLLRARLVGGGLATAADLTVDRLAEVLESWHVGAASSFASGRPPDRRSPLARPGTVTPP